MKNHKISLLLAVMLAGCAVNRPQFYEKTTGTNGVVMERRLAVSTWTFWPATSEIGKQKASLGKTFSLGQSELDQSGGGTNMVEALKSIDSIIGKLSPR
jgi:hypothetical protein